MDFNCVLFSICELEEDKIKGRSSRAKEALEPGVEDLV